MYIFVVWMTEYKNNYRSLFIFPITFCLKITVQLGQNIFSQFSKNFFSKAIFRHFSFLQNKAFYIKTLHINILQWKNFQSFQNTLFVLHLYSTKESGINPGHRKLWGHMMPLIIAKYCHPSCHSETSRKITWQKETSDSLSLVTKWAY